MNFQKTIKNDTLLLTALILRRYILKVTLNLFFCILLKHKAIKQQK